MTINAPDWVVVVLFGLAIGLLLGSFTYLFYQLTNAWIERRAQVYESMDNLFDEADDDCHTYADLEDDS